MYWLVAGLHRPRFSDQLRQNVERLRRGRSNVSALIVETGAAVGLWGHRHEAIRQDDCGVVPFLNLALAHLKHRASPDDWFVRVDADDYYGAGYLDQIETVQAAGAVATGAPSIFVRGEEGQLFYCATKRARFLGACGGTLAGRVGDALSFRDTGAPWGEDSAWVSDMVSAGHRVEPHTGCHYALLRWEEGQHTYPVRGDELPHFWNCDSYRVGDWDPELLKQPPQGLEPLSMDPNLAMRAARRLSDLVQ